MLPDRLLCLQKQQVLLFATVSGANKWRGYAQMTSPIAKSSAGEAWCGVRWQTLFQPGPSQLRKDDVHPGLPFRDCEHILLPSSSPATAAEVSAKMLLSLLR